MEKLHSNMYRITKMCSNCPFRNDEHAIHLSEGRLDSIKEALLRGENFVCHKTVYSKDSKQKPLMCAGAYEFLIKNKQPNQIMQIAERIGVEKHIYQKKSNNKV
jgi:hypothetical protein